MKYYILITIENTLIICWFLLNRVSKLNRVTGFTGFSQIRVLNRTGLGFFNESRSDRFDLPVRTGSTGRSGPIFKTLVYHYAVFIFFSAAFLDMKQRMRQGCRQPSFYVDFSFIWFSMVQNCSVDFLALLD